VYSCNAKESDFDVIFDWIQNFHEEVLIGTDDKSYLKNHVDLVLNNNNVFVWKTKNEGVPVSMVFRERPQTDTISIGYVYTPKSLRQKGYATSLVYDVCKRSLREGYKYCTLFADEVNPISNSIYKKIGFKEVCQYTLLEVR
jgi:hypothetical protein